MTAPEAPKGVCAASAVPYAGPWSVVYCVVVGPHRDDDHYAPYRGHWTEDTRGRRGAPRTSEQPSLFDGQLTLF